MKGNQWISTCCRATTTVIGSDEGTNYFECNNCHKPCNSYVGVAKSLLKKVDKLLHKEQRAKEIYRLRCEGLTLDEIGEVFHLTRERIRQILIQNYPGIQFKYCKKPLKPVAEKICLYKKCGNVFIPPRVYKRKMYCSKECQILGNGGIVRSHMTDVELRKLNSERAGLWYHKHKNEPSFKKKTKERNKIAEQKRKAIQEEKNPYREILQSLASKRTANQNVRKMPKNHK